jgi:uncharacterized protein (DUF305 family)
VPPPTSRIAAGLAACLATLLLSSCSRSPSDGHAHSTRSDDKPVITGEPAPFNPADVAFANNAVALEDQGTTISQLAPEHSGNPELATFATKTAAALQVDTQVLKALRAQWKEGQDNRTGDSGWSTTPAPTLDDASVAKLGALHGPEFDTAWLQSMISLDQSAIQLANTEVAGGKNIDATSLAKQITKARQAEIGQMQPMLAG